jgi:hypothetical protein
MSKQRRSCAMFVLLAGSLVSPALVAQPLLPLGSELQVNSYTTDRQGAPKIAVGSAGDFVVVWESYQQDGSFEGVFARRFDASGAPQGGEFQVNSYTPSSQKEPAAAMDDDGDFVVVWGNLLDESGFEVFARRFDASGIPQGIELQINTYTVGNQRFPAVAVEGDGDFVVAWQSNGQDGDGAGVFARRFASSGLPEGAEVRANSFTVGSQAFPVVAVADDGDFVVVWQSASQDGSGGGIFARRFDAFSVPQAAEFRVNAHTSAEQRGPTVAMDNDGGFVVSWSSFDQDGDDFGIFARRFDGSGAPQDEEFRVNRYTIGAQDSPQVALDDDGDFVVTWQSLDQEGSSYGVFARRFDAEGFPRGGEIQVNSYTLGAQSDPTIGLDSDGTIAVVAWQGAGQDGSDDGVFTQRLTAPAVLDVDGDGSLTALTDGLLILRFFFGFTGANLTSGAVGSGCTRCDATAIADYLESLT